jgi:flagellar biosynthesis protein FlhB
MASSKIELRKIRDFGANLSDTFEFIRQNFKPLLLSFFAISGIFILLQAISYGTFESGIFRGAKLQGNVFTGSRIFFVQNMFRQYLTGSFFLYIFFAWLGFASMNVCVGAYMKHYDQHSGEKPDLEEVWTIFKRYYLKVLILSIPVAVITVLGYFLCFLPGVFLTVVFVPFPWVIIMEDASLGEGISRCFELNRSFFWVSFGIYLVAYLIYSFASGIIGLMIGTLTGLITYLTTKDLGSTIGIVTSVLRVFTYIFYIIFLVSAMLHYFSLAEQHDATGMLHRIDQMGKDTGDDPHTGEQY